ncbi:hypothetical protein D9M71_528260 [compost metagenome]
MGHGGVQRVARGANHRDARRPWRAHQYGQRGQQQGGDRRDDAARHGVAGIGRFFRGGTHLLDADEHPDREGHAGEDAPQADGLAEAAAAEQVGGFDLGQHRGAEDQQRRGGNGPGQQGDPERFADAANMDADDHGEQRDLHRPAAEAEDRLHVRRDESGGGAGADGQGDGAGGADQVADEGAEGALRIGKHPAGVGHGAGQLADAQRQATAQCRHQQGGQQHVGPAIVGKAVVPTGKLAGDHQRDAEPRYLGPAEYALFEHDVWFLAFSCCWEHAPAQTPGREDVKAGRRGAI